MKSKIFLLEEAGGIKYYLIRSLLDNYGQRNTMVPLTNIHSLTDFRHNAKKFAEQVQTTHTPLVLTVNGQAALVVEDVASFEAYRKRIQDLEQEVQRLKLSALKDAVVLGAEQAEQGQFSKRSFDDIIAAARAAVAEDSSL